MTSSPIAYLGQIIVATGNGKVFSLNENGTQAWNRSVASVIYSSSPAVANQVIYIGADDGKLHALAANGYQSCGQFQSVARSAVLPS